MKHRFVPIALMMYGLAFGQGVQKDSVPDNPNYDPVLAQEFGADDYGMKSYYLVMLKTGENTTADKGLISESFRGHMENINRLVEEGKLIVAGPLGQNDKTYRGIFIFDKVGSLEEMEEVLRTDPAIGNGLLAHEIYPWYGSAVLSAYLPVSHRIWKLKP